MKLACAALSALVLAAVAPAAASAAPVAQVADAEGRPALIVTIVVDQLGANLFNQYRGRLSGGLARLAGEGVVYPNGYQSHAMTETCPGHSTILTGAHPAATGIPANDWIDRRTGQELYCLAAPANALAHGRNTDNGPVGPDHLLVSALPDWLKSASPDSRVFAVSGKDRGAITLNSRTGDGAFWYTNDFGFTTYVEPGQTAEARLAPVAALNARIAARMAAAPPSWDYRREDCRALEGQWRVGDQTFRSTLPPARVQVDVSPLLDELTLEAAGDLLETQALGRRGVTDMLGVSLSATDRVGHTYGNQGPEMCEQIHRLDAALGDFLDKVAAVPGGALVVLTADHGGADFPERQAEWGFPDAHRGDPALIGRLNTALKAQFGLAADPVSYGGSGLMIVDADNRPLAEPLRSRVVAAAVEQLRAEPSVAGAWTLEAVLASPPPAPGASPQEYSLLERQRVGAVAGRSPDVLIALQPNVTPGPGIVGAYLAGHGTPWDYDRRVPILFWSPGATGQERAPAIRTIDIAPTLAAAAGLTPPDTVEGRCLQLPFAGAGRCNTP